MKFIKNLTNKTTADKKCFSQEEPRRETLISKEYAVVTLNIPDPYWENKLYRQLEMKHYIPTNKLCIGSALIARSH